MSFRGMEIPTLRSGALHQLFSVCICTRKFSVMHPKFWREQKTNFGDLGEGK